MTKTILSVEEIQDALSAIVDDAEGRDLTDAEHTEIEGLEKDLGEAQARRDRTEGVRARNAERRKIVTPALHPGGKPKDDDETATLDRAFTAYLRTGRENADLQQLRAAQSEGVGSEGGFTVPDGMRNKIVERMKAFGGLANVVEEITTETGNNLTWLTIGDDTANRGEIVAEGAAPVGGADLTFGEASLGAYSYMSQGAGGQPLRVSRELAQDSAINLEDLISRKLGERIARRQAEDLVRGTGVNEPQGIVTGRTGIQLFNGASDTLIYADFLKAIHALDPAYRNENCRWAFNDATIATARGLLDGAGRPLLNESSASITEGPRGFTILGYPVTIDQAFANPSVNSSSVNWGVFGDLREGYVVRRVRQIELLVNPYSRMSNRQIEYSAWARMDAVQQNTNAYVALTGTP